MDELTTRTQKVSRNNRKADSMRLTISADWIRRNDIWHGDDVLVEYHDTYFIVHAPESREDDE